MLTSPHADEILSAAPPHGSGELAAGHARLAGHLARWIAEGVAEGRLTLAGLEATPEEMAATIMATKAGIKSFSRDLASYRAAEARIAAVFGKAMTP